MWCSPSGRDLHGLTCIAPSNALVEPLLTGMSFEPEKWPMAKAHCDVLDVLSCYKTITDKLPGIMSLV